MRPTGAGIPAPATAAARRPPTEVLRDGDQARERRVGVREGSGGWCTSKGNEAHGRRALVPPATWCRERRTRRRSKALELPPPSSAASTHWPGNGPMRADGRTAVGNGRRATATVTWCGCRRGDSFEGCEPRCGDGRPTPESRRATGAGRAGGDARNAANPRIGSGMQQARAPPSGGNRRGGAKPRGRNGIRGWPPRTEADRPFIRTALSVGVDARRTCRWRGHQRRLQRELRATAVPDPTSRPP